MNPEGVQPLITSGATRGKQPSKKNAANSTIQMPNKAKMIMLLKIGIGNFIPCKKQNFLK